MRSQSLFRSWILLSFITYFLILSINREALASTLINKEAISNEANLQSEAVPVPEKPTLEVQSQPNVINQTYLLIKLSKRRVYLYQDGKLQDSYPIAIGKAGWETPTGVFEIIDIQRNPTWQNPFTGKIILPGSNNPLGKAWIGFWSDGTNQLGFHGTLNESLVGRPVSHGCVRMRNQDILKLYEQVVIGMPVKVVP